MFCFVSIDVEIGKVRGNLFQINGNEKKPMVLPEAVGAPVNLSEKVYVPVKEFPDVSICSVPVLLYLPVDTRLNARLLLL